jgi:primase-polymerase (primpol)-like protein
MFERIPEELKRVHQWHCWKNVDGTKIPIQVDGSSAKSNDPATWTDFETASDAAQFHSGLAFEITSPWTGIDLDDCIDDQGIKSWCLEILCRFDGVGFAEVSPSGNGIKILTRGRKPEGSRCSHKLTEGGVECYDNRRFWTITGDLYNGQDEIGDGQDAINWLCEKFLSREKKDTNQVHKEALLTTCPMVAGVLFR